MDIKAEITRQRDNWGHLGVPHPVEDFVLRFGTPRSGQPFEGEQCQSKKCFHNAMELAVEGDFKYVEGFAARPNFPLLFGHAWCEDADGKVIDPTWDNPEGAFYMGVSFSRAMAIATMLETGIYGLFENEVGVQTGFLEAETARRKGMENG